MPPNNKPSHVQVAGLLEVAVFLSVLLPLIGTLGGYYWLFDLFSHFRLQYIGCILVCSLAFFVMRRKKTGWFCVLAVALLLAPLHTFFWSEQKATLEHTLKLISFNVNTANNRYDDVANFVISENADVAFLMELDSNWLKGLSALDKAYPHRLSQVRDDNFGLAVFSKYPFTKQQILLCAGDEIPAAEFSIRLLDQDFHFTGIHTLPPEGKDYTHARNEELMGTAQMAAGVGGNVILMGDFNLTPFSPWFARVLRTSGLKDSAAGHGVSPTWQRHIPWFAIPIDHVLVSKHLVVLSRRIGDNLGSDHNPLILELGVR